MRAQTHHSLHAVNLGSLATGQLALWKLPSILHFSCNDHGHVQPRHSVHNKQCLPEALDGSTSG